MGGLVFTSDFAATRKDSAAGTYTIGGQIRWLEGPGGDFVSAQPFWKTAT